MAGEHETSAHPWGTLEELLLASAVNRHGTKSWDSIALELQTRRNSVSSSSSSSFTPQLCKDKFFDLKRRFISPNEAASSSGLVDQLRRIRVEELRREVQQRDVSILSLELKVKRLVEERERTLKEEPDLDGRQNKLSPEIDGCEPTAGNDSGDPDDRSFNESNSTSQKPEEATPTTTVTVKDEKNDVEAVEKVGGGGGEKKAQVKTEPGVGSEPDPVRTGKGPGNEGVNGEEGDNKKQTSDVQSSASLWMKKPRGVNSDGGSSSGEEREVSPAKKGGSGPAVKPEFFVKLLGIILSHRLGSAFRRRQRSQESERYKNLIRQHIDLERIESRLEKGVYSSDGDGSPKFFRDLLLLFNNVMVFHRKNSPEHIAAQELRGLVSKEMRDYKQLRKQATAWKPEPEELPPVCVSKPNKSSTMSIAACSKRGSIKEVTENNATRKRKVVEDDKPKPKPKPKADSNSNSNSNYFAGTGIDEIEKGIRKKRSNERAVSARRNSTRTSGKMMNEETKHEYGGNELSSHDTLELKVDKKEKPVPRKKQGAASFLKRMKQNSPSQVTTDKDDDDDDDDDDHSEEEKGRGKKRDVKRVTRSSGGRGAREEGGRVKRGVGRPPKRAAAAAPETKGKRGRDNGDNEVGVGGGGRARKRSRR
ncbi:hypothetical protein CCACVL1_08419 [Corchorus capsularis]|uniref:Bromo domain-containing protein n=1 Tax=Corchorus capsularis TaxID=210143 RepID=A0A1R3J0M6_COCAP|nr:hypothetical protein CCACVL1_08419 [Corchorus capsularis]